MRQWYEFKIVTLCFTASYKVHVFSDKRSGIGTLGDALADCEDGSYCCQLLQHDCCTVTSVGPFSPATTSPPLSDIRFLWPTGSAVTTINATALEGLTSSTSGSIQSTMTPLLTVPATSITNPAKNTSSLDSNAHVISLGAGLGTSVSLSIVFGGFVCVLYKRRRKRRNSQYTGNGLGDGVHSETNNEPMECQLVLKQNYHRMGIDFLRWYGEHQPRRSFIDHHIGRWRWTYIIRLGVFHLADSWRFNMETRQRRSKPQTSQGAAELPLYNIHVYIFKTSM